MINPKRLVEIVHKWQKIASIGRRRISFMRMDSGVAHKGHFVIYTTDNRRFVIPLAYLNTNIFRGLFKLSEEEFGLPGNGPITLPCDSVFMEYVVSLVGKLIYTDLEKALLTSIATGQCSISSLLPQGPVNQQILLHGF